MELVTHKKWKGGHLMPWGKGTVVTGAKGFVFLSGNTATTDGTAKPKQLRFGEAGRRQPNPSAHPIMTGRADTVLCRLGANSKHRPVYSISLSARSTRPAGISWRIACAALRLMTSSNWVGCSTGMSAGLTPRKILTSCRTHDVAIDLDEARTISEEALLLRHFRPLINCGKPQRRNAFENDPTIVEEKRRGQHIECGRA